MLEGADDEECTEWALLVSLVVVMSSLVEGYGGLSRCCFALHFVWSGVTYKSHVQLASKFIVKGFTGELSLSLE